MSLQTLAALRSNRRSPAAVWVVVGDCPKSIREMPDTIAVEANPAAMDWRPVVGLHVDVFDLQRDPMLLLRTMDAIEAAEPKVVCVACDSGVIGLSKEHESVLWRIWRHLASRS